MRLTFRTVFGGLGKNPKVRRTEQILRSNQNMSPTPDLGNTRRSGHREVTALIGRLWLAWNSAVPGSSGDVREDVTRF